MGQSSGHPGADRRSIPDVEVAEKVIIAPAPVDSVSDVSSIDKLLELADGEEWNIDAQVRSLQIAAVDPSRDAAAAERARGPSLAAPTPFDLSPLGSVSRPPPPLPSKAPPAPGSGSLPVPAALKKSLPPPLPPAASRADQIGTAIAQAAASGAARHARRSPERARRRARGGRRQGGPRARAHRAGDRGRDRARRRRADRWCTPRPRCKVDPRPRAQRTRCCAASGTVAGAIAAMLKHLEHELAAATEEAATVELLVEKARPARARRRKARRVRAAWEQALMRAPHHAAALKGLEVGARSRATQAIAGRRRDDANARRAPRAHGRRVRSRAAPRRVAARRARAHPGVAARHASTPRAARSSARCGSIRASGPCATRAFDHVAAHHDCGGARRGCSTKRRASRPSGARSARLELDAACHRADCAWRRRARDRAARARRGPRAHDADRRPARARRAGSPARARGPLGRGRARAARAPALRHRSRAPRVRAAARSRRCTSGSTIPRRRFADIQRALAIDPTDTDARRDARSPARRGGQATSSAWRSGSTRPRAPKTARSARERSAAPRRSARRLGAAARRGPPPARGVGRAPGRRRDRSTALARSCRPRRRERVDREVRALIELYAQARRARAIPGGEVAYLEKIAHAVGGADRRRRRARRARTRTS